MSYNKPEITSLASASFAIQGGQSKSSTINHDQTNPFLVTPAAYEADE